MSNRNKVSRIAALEQRLLQQEEELARLRADLVAARHGGFHSMRQVLRCPACGSGALLHIRAATELDDNGLKPMTVHHTSGFWGAKGYGPIEHFVCRRCRLIESHAIDLEGVEPDGTNVIAIEPPAEPEMPAGPFR